MSHQHQQFESGPDARIRRLDQEIKQLESHQNTWRNPLQLAKLQAKRRRRDLIERSRLCMGWAALGTDGSAA